jgi:hypothetical protein
LKESSHGKAMGGSGGVLARGAGGLEDERADRQRVQPPAQGLQAPPVRLAKSAGVDVRVATHVEAAPTAHSSRLHVELTLRNGRQLRVPADFPPKALADLAAALEATAAC